MKVTENENGSFTIEWDPNDELERAFNDWTEQDFIDCIVSKAKEILEKND